MDVFMLQNTAKVEIDDCKTSTDRIICGSTLFSTVIQICMYQVDGRGNMKRFMQ